MLNCVTLIGKLVDTPTVRLLDDGIKVCNISLSVMRPFKNQSGEYGIDFIPVSLWYGNAQIAEEYCTKGDTVCIRGRLVNKVQEINGINYHFLELIGERLIFINLKSYQDENKEK